MNIDDEILINKYGQDLIAIGQLQDRFELLNTSKRKVFLSYLVNLILQSRPNPDDIDLAIKVSELKSTYTPCVLLRKGVTNAPLQRIIDLPESEFSKTFVLFLNLFKIAYKRRFDKEKNEPNKWWYWDLSDNDKIKQIPNR